MSRIPVDETSVEYHERTKRRFVDKVSVDDTTGCWNWTAFVGPVGYGKFGMKRDGKCKHFDAHRAAYLIFVGAIENGLVIDHLCNNKVCVNPEHLEAVTQRENVNRAPLDKWDTRANWYTPRKNCRRGHALHRFNGRVSCLECRRLRRAGVL